MRDDARLPRARRAQAPELGATRGLLWSLSAAAVLLAGGSCGLRETSIGAVSEATGASGGQRIGTDAGGSETSGADAGGANGSGAVGASSTEPGGADAGANAGGVGAGGAAGASTIAPGPGLLAEYFDELELVAPFGIFVDPNIEYGPPGMAETVQARGMTPSTLSVRWTGQILLASSEPYKLGFATAGRVRLWVDADLLIDGWIDHATVTEQSTSATVPGGSWHDLKIEWQQEDGDLIDLLYFSSPSQPLSNVPPAALRHR